MLSSASRILPLLLLLASWPIATPLALSQELETSHLAPCDPSLAQDDLSVEAIRSRWNDLPDEVKKRPQCQLALATLQFLANRPGWSARTAHETLNRLDSEGQGLSDTARRLRGLLCVSLIATERFEAAVEFCTPTASDAPEWVRYYQGIARFKTGDSSGAVRSLFQVDDGALPGIARLSWRRFQDLALGSTLGIKPGFHALVTFAAGYDSNPLSSPEDFRSVGLTDSVHSPFESLSLTVRYNTPVWRRFLFQTRAAFSHRLHNNEDALALDQTRFSAGPSLSYLMVPKGRILEWGLNATYNSVLLRGGYPTPEPDRYVFLESVDFSTGPVWHVAPRVKLAGYYTASFQRFREMARNATGHRVGFRESFWLSSDLLLEAFQQAAFEQSDGPYRRWGATGAVGVTWRFQPRWTLQTSAGGGFEPYFNSGSYFGEDPRRDIHFSGTTGLAFEFADSLRLVAEGSYVGRRSTAETFTYDRVTGSLSLQWEGP